MQTVKVWDATSGQEMLTLKGHTDVVMSVAFSPDGKRLASAGVDRMVKVWDATSGQETAHVERAHATRSAAWRLARTGNGWPRQAAIRR